MAASGCERAGERLAYRFAHQWQSPYGREHTLIGRFVTPSDGRFVDQAAVIKRLAAARYVLLGETHDNPDHHILQARLIGALVEAGRRPAIVFEMIAPSQADALERHLRAQPNDAAGLGSALGWAEAGWPPWSLYQPIADVALDAGLRLAAGNLDPNTVRALARGQPADRALIDRLGLDAPLPPALQASLEREIGQAHCGYVEGEALGAMALGQRARDAAMARAMIDAATPDGAVLIAGSGHCRDDRGVPYHLRRFEPDALSVSLALIEVTAGKDQPADYAASFDGAMLPFDLVCFTARIDTRDACERFKEQLEKMKAKGASSGD